MLCESSYQPLTWVTTQGTHGSRHCQRRLRLGNYNWWRELSLVLYLYHGLHRGKNELIYLHIRQRRQGILMTEIDVNAQVLWLQQNNLTLLDR
jgi:hypothetical protein